MESMSKMVLSVAMVIVAAIGGMTPHPRSWDTKFSKTDRSNVIKLYEQAQRCTKLPFEFSELPATYSNNAETFPEKTKIRIGVKEGLSSQVQAIDLAHELYHAILTCEGFSQVAHIPKSVAPEDREFYLRIGRESLDCVHDALIDRRLKDLGFSPELDSHERARLMDKSFPFSKADLSNERLQRLNGLYLYCSSHRLRYFVDDLEPRWATHSADVVHYAQVLAARVPDVSCNDPLSCFVIAKQIRDVMGYPVVKLVSSKTGAEE